MSLYYGYDGEQSNVNIPRSNDFFTTFTYGALSETIMSLPVDIKTGHPTPVPYVGKYITEDTAFELMTYTLDKDGAISDLIVRFQLIVYSKSGSQYAYSLGNFDVSANMLLMTGRNICVVDKSFKLSEYHQDYKNITVAYVKVGKVSGTEAGNESALTVRIAF